MYTFCWKIILESEEKLRFVKIFTRLTILLKISWEEVSNYITKKYFSIHVRSLFRGQDIHDKSNLINFVQYFHNNIFSFDYFIKNCVGLKKGNRNLNLIRLTNKRKRILKSTDQHIFPFQAFLKPFLDNLSPFNEHFGYSNEYLHFCTIYCTSILYSFVFNYLVKKVIIVLCFIDMC